MYLGEATKQPSGMANEIVQGALDGKLDIVQDMVLRLATGTEGSLGKEMENKKSTGGLERRGRGKKWVGNLFL